MGYILHSSEMEKCVWWGKGQWSQFSISEKTWETPPQHEEKNWVFNALAEVKVVFLSSVSLYCTLA